MDLLGIKLALQGMFAELGKKTSNTTNGGVPLLNTQTGEPNGMIAMSDLANVLEAQHSFTCGLTIASYDGDYLRFRRLDQAASYKSTAVGIGIFEAGHLLIVAKDETQAKWSEERVSGGTAACGREAALIDTHGREKTQTIVNTLGANAPAASFCQNYCPSNVANDNAFVGKGRWWLPAAGELWMMYARLYELNRALIAIDGTPLDINGAYWSSTESGATYAWRQYFYNGTFNYNGKEGVYRVRPVSAFY